jgi:hypothetical protein
MNGLPGNLTERHIEMAKKRGDGCIIYHHKVYSIEELENLAGISRVKPEPKTRKKLYSERAEICDGQVSAYGSERSEEQSRSGE